VYRGADKVKGRDLVKKAQCKGIGLNWGGEKRWSG